MNDLMLYSYHLPFVFVGMHWHDIKLKTSSFVSKKICIVQKGGGGANKPERAS